MKGHLCFNKVKIFEYEVRPEQFWKMQLSFTLKPRIQKVRGYANTLLQNTTLSSNVLKQWILSKQGSTQLTF